ncbi:TPA: hypothetical protein IGZ61_002560 [Escherichia coli]|jgi:hypothetical protein|nr:hypothetical protein [Escherichia coli]
MPDFLSLCQPSGWLFIVWSFWQNIFKGGDNDSLSEPVVEDCIVLSKYVNNEIDQITTGI